MGHRAIAILVLITVCCSNSSESLSPGASRKRREDAEPITCKNGGTWHEQTERCTCTLGWIGVQCDIWHNHHCYFDNGLNYRGKLSRTNEGTTCQPWTTSDNSMFELGKNGIGIHNYCRNPDDDERGLWCYVGGNEFMGYCNATRCPDSVRDLLSINATDIGTGDDTSAAVQFLFGPLISGVCAGVVALLASIAIAEYLRRKKYCTRKRKQQQKMDTKDTEGVKKEEKYEKNGKEGSENDKNESPGIRTLGGIITVDVDTGKEKFRAYTAEDVGNMSGTMLPVNVSGQINKAFIHTEEENSRRISVDTLEMGPPPPYRLDDDEILSMDSDMESRMKGVTPVLLTVKDDLEDVDIEHIDEEQAARRESERKRKTRKKQRSENPRTIPDFQTVIEGNTGGDDYSSMGKEKPVPRPRKSTRNRPDAEDVPRGTKARRGAKRERNRNDPENVEHNGSVSTDIIRAKKKTHRDVRKRCENQIPNDFSRVKRHSFDNNNKADYSSVSTAAKSEHGEKTKKRRPRAKQTTDSRHVVGDPSRRRKSVRELARDFDATEMGTENIEYKNIHDSPNPFMHYDRETSERKTRTVVNNKDEPTTFL